MKPIRAIRRAAALSVLLLAAAPAAADQNGRVPANQEIIEQKAGLVENMAYRSVAARTIAESGDAAAVVALDEAKALIEEAKNSAAEGEYQTADAKLNQALGLINETVQRLSKAEVQGERSKEAFERRRHAVELFLESYQRVAADGESEATTPAAEHAEWIAGRLAEADAQAAAEDYEAAFKPLEEAYERTRELIRSIRTGQVLTRSLQFETAEEAYQYELKRNDSHFALLEFAIAEKNPQGSVVDRIEEYRLDAQAARKSAEGSARDGAFPEAIGDLNDSTSLLQRAIRMSGIFIPG